MTELKLGDGLSSCVDKLHDKIQEVLVICYGCGVEMGLETYADSQHKEGIVLGPIPSYWNRDKYGEYCAYVSMEGRRLLVGIPEVNFSDVDVAGEFFRTPEDAAKHIIDNFKNNYRITP